jgi:error-prone DNA polymerase
MNIVPSSACTVGTKIVAGLVALRQRPETAHGTTFLTLEDETGVVQMVVWPDLCVRQRKELLGSRLLIVDGRWDKADGVSNLIATRLHDLPGMLGGLDTRSRDFH